MGLFKRRTRAQKILRLDELEPMIASGKPVLIDFMQVNCGPCQIMDGIVNELAAEYGESAHVVKVDVTKVPGAAQMFGVRSTPTFVVVSKAPEKRSKRNSAPIGGRRIGTRWRTSGLVKKDQLQRVLESNGAQRIDP